MKKTIPVVGMACASCSANVERKLNSLEGVSSASVSLPGRCALVDYDPQKISLEQMKKAVSDIGYDLVIEQDRSVEQIEKRAYALLRRRTILSWIFALAVMSISMHWVNLGGRDMNNQVSLLLALANLVFCGKQFYVTAIRQLRHLSANMDTLVALSTFVSFTFSAFNTFWGDDVWGSRGIEWSTYYDASVMIITFVLTGRMLEEKAKDGTAASIKKMMGLQPKTARVISELDADGKARTYDEVPIRTIDKGDLIEVRAGEKIPVDGTVSYAESFMTPDAAYVDEAMITGEPTPAKKTIGSTVKAGTIPSQGKIYVKAEQIGGETELARIIETVQQAQASKAPVQRIVDKIAMIFVPVVTGIAVLTFLVWWIVGGNEALPHAILSAVAVLVVACPCAMGLATPTAIMVGIGKAASKQILIKDATALESMRRVNALVTDKTGTLTIPKPTVDFTKADNLKPEERETLKPNAREAIDKLKADGVDVWMISGDTDEAVSYWARKAGIDHYYSKVKPDDKAKLVEKLQSEGKNVAMVGDGINDTQALAKADVSIAMGKGTDVAMNVAQVTLMGDDLNALPTAVNLSRITVKMIYENLFWAFIYNIITIPLAAGVLRIFGIDFQISPMWASALMAFSSVSVVLNSLRLNFKKV